MAIREDVTPHARVWLPKAIQTIIFPEMPSVAETSFSKGWPNQEAVDWDPV